PYHAQPHPQRSPRCLSLSTRPPPPTSPLFPYTTLFRSSRTSRTPYSQRPPRTRCGQEQRERPLPIVQSDMRGSPRVIDAAKRQEDRKSTRLNSSHVAISYAVFCLKKKKTTTTLSHSLLR